MEILIFFAVSAISFAGSGQAGSVNVSVIKTTILKNKSAGIWLAIGGCLPEMIYATLAIYAGMAIQTNKFFLQFVDWLTIIAFLVLGFQNIFKPLDVNFDQTGFRQAGKDFLKGFLLALLNPQLIIFWFGVFVYLDTNWMSIKSFTARLAFILGTSFGAFTTLYLLAILSHRHREKIYSLLKTYSINKLTGWFFISLVAIKILSIFLFRL